MKKLLVVLIVSFLWISCIREPEFHSFQIGIKVEFPEGIPAEAKAGAKVTLFNQLKSYSSELLTDENGQVNFMDIEPGFYSITIVHSYGEGGFEYYFNGLETMDIFNSVNKVIKLSASKTNALVIREFYYSGSLTPAGKLYPSDQYFEIFNNSDRIQYADGISVLEHESYGIGDNFWSTIKDTIVVKMIWTIPGTGTDVPVLPGQSIVLAVDGINHKSDPNGNPNSPVDLGNADFEFFVLKEPSEDIDVPNVSNLDEDLFTKRADDVNFHARGGSAIAIAKLPGKNQAQRIGYINRNLVPKEPASGSSTSYYAKIPNEYVIDAVEVVYDEAHAIYKRFPVGLDAGFTFVPSGSKSGKCIRRKIKETINGRVIYQDTNNSTEDFLKDVNPKPKIYAE